MFFLHFFRSWEAPSTSRCKYSKNHSKSDFSNLCKPKYLDMPSFKRKKISTFQILIIILLFYFFSSQTPTEASRLNDQSLNSQSQDVQEFVCQHSSETSPQGTSVVRPTWIHLSPSPLGSLAQKEPKVGFLRTPNFPLPFQLPLECLWIFNLTEISSGRQANPLFLHFYFTQVSVDIWVRNIFRLVYRPWLEFFYESYFMRMARVFDCKTYF